MSIRRVGILLGKEFTHGASNFIFIMAIVMPVILSLIVSLLFGNFLSDRSKLGIVDEGSSSLVDRAAENKSLLVREYETAEELKQAVGRGAVDLGIVLPGEFDRLAAAGDPLEIQAYIWGESALKHRAVLGTTLLSLIREASGHDPPVEVVTSIVGETSVLPWQDRLLPFVVLMTMLIGGAIVPAMSLAEEREQRTLTAVTVTPTSLADVLTSKGLLGVLVSVAMALVTLTINGAFGGQPALLIVTLTLGASLASMFGLLLGVMAKDVNTLFGTIKSMGIFLYAPAFIFMFPEIPQWIARVFPTYYIIQPVVEITQQGAVWADVLPELGVLVGLIGLLGAAVSLTAQRKAQATA
jgi:ABC-2 type transport system permease protein